jgi:Hypothetical glycosyl hydrolase family 15
MNRREFLHTGIVLAGGASLGELHAAQQAFSGGDQIALHDTGEVASKILPPLHAPGAMWLSTQGDPGTMLDAPLRRFLFTRMPTTVVLNGELKGYKKLVADTHAQFPNLKVLRYSHAQRVPEGTRVASTMFPHFFKYAKDLALIRTDGSPKIVGPEGDLVVWTDITLPATRDYIVSHIAAQVAEHGADGVAIDAFQTHLVTTNLRDPWKADLWPAACVAILEDLGLAMPGKLIWFNGIWAWDQSVIDDQAELLKYADGASVEFYGYDDNGKITTETFERIVQPINAMLERHPDKPILVRGTSLHGTFYDYVTDLRNARYCYGCYLLAKTSGSFFNYGQNFQIARRFAERTGGAALYSYFELPLGQPTGPAVANDTGGWSRMYEGGQVFVAPAEGKLQQFQVGFDSWTTTGTPHPWGSVLLVRPADAVILLRNKPTPPPYSLEANIADSSNEWLVQCETGEYRYNYLTLSVSSTDPQSAVLVRFETDDKPKPFGILEIMPELTPGVEPFDPGDVDYPYRYTTTLRAAHVRNRAQYPTNGAWTAFRIPLQTGCFPYPCFRVTSVKAVGGVSVRLIRLTEPEVIPQ